MSIPSDLQPIPDPGSGPGNGPSRPEGAGTGALRPAALPGAESRPPVVFSIAPIGLVHLRARHPRRPSRFFVARRCANLELFHPYGPGLRGLHEGLEVLVLAYHAPEDAALDARFQASGDPGVFATAAPDRPNPIECLRARVVEADPDRGLLRVEGLDCEDGILILDIRPLTIPLHRLVKPVSQEGRP